MNGAIWAKYVDSYEATLLALADIASHVASHPASDDFTRVLAEANGLGWLREDGLADMGMVERSTANRWINGAARPSKLQQCIIMGKLAKLLRDVSGEMK